MAQIPLNQKFHTLNADTPTVERGSAQADGLREIYTMQDIIDSVTTGGGIDFVELGDTPSTYAGAAGLAAIVNATEDGLIFGPAGGGATEGEKLDFTVRSDAYAATGDHEGTDLKIGGAASVTAGTVYYWNGDWAAADNTAVGTSTGMIAVATDTGTAVNMLKEGIIQLAANPSGAVAGSVLYVGTSGALTITPPTGTGEVVRVAGYTIDTAGLIYFDPSADWIVLA